jgi:hypothetical protein
MGVVVKKTLFALAFLCEISFGMNQRDTYRSITDKFGNYSNLYDQWRNQFSGYENFEKRGTPESKALEADRDAAKPKEFDSAILEAVIRYDIGSDNDALQLLQLLFNCKLHELIDFYSATSTKMLPLNAGRFKEILLFIAPILNIQGRWTNDLGFTSIGQYKEDICKIVSIWGGDPTIIKPNMMQYPQFCFEMFLMMVLKLKDSGSGILFQAVRCMVDEFLARQYEWNGKEGEAALYDLSVGNYEDDGGQCEPKDVWKNWN